jgi:two-component system, NarL family, sensor histidine kinase UhpB
MTAPITRRRIHCSTQGHRRDLRPIRRPPRSRPQRTPTATIFEQVILTNSAIIVIGALATYLITHLSYEPYHYLIDTLFVVLVTVAGVAINALLLRRAFQPLFGMLATIQAVQAGQTERRVTADVSAADIAQLAHAFNTMLDTLDASRRASLRSVAQAQEAERRHLALELHDATGQEITALALRLEYIRQEIAEVEDLPALGDVQDHLDDAIALAQRTLRGVQGLAQHLRPTVLDDLGLSAALHWLAAEMQRGTTAAIAVTAGEYRAPLTEQQALAETMIFRVAQEALTNALRHSGANTIQINLRRSRTSLTLTVRDDGQGFSLADRHLGTGLSSMQERMALVGGRCEMRSARGMGTTITARVPLREREMAA